MALTAGTWSLTTQVQIQGAAIAAQGDAASNTLATPAYGPSSSDKQSLTFGTTSAKADILVAVQNTLTAGASATYDILTGTDLKNLYGQTAAMVKLKGICVVIDDGGSALGLTIGGAAANANILFFGNVNDTWTIYPSGPPFAGGNDAGVTVDATHCNIKILNNAAVSVTFTIYLAGTSV